ncbi:MAG: methyltransferase domain-containing protein [Actinobacteria bacterium]|nr:methyltransferase domain-containing protein [Actinomycetota bacterium]
MTVDRYAGAARRWAHGAALVYAPIAEELVATAPHPLTGRRVLDVGAGTGVASTVLTRVGARPLATDLSHDMLAWDHHARPPAIVANVYAMPVAPQSVDDVVAAFVLNHLVQPVRALAELRRVTRPGGALLACVYANSSRSEARDAIDDAARQRGWEVPAWYVELKREATPLLGTAPDFQRAAKEAGFVDLLVDERAVDVGVDEPEQLVDYRLGQANYSAWLDELGPHRADEVKAQLVEVIRPIMRPYRPIVVFVSATIPRR